MNHWCLGGQRAEASGETGAPHRGGYTCPRNGGEGHPGQLRTLGAYGKLATQFTLDQDPTFWVEEEPMEEGK